MELLKTVTAKVVSGAVALAVVAAGISWWRMDDANRQMVLGGTGKIVAWVGVVLVLPWVTFFVIGRVAKAESNLAGGALVMAYTLLEVVLLGWLFEWSMPGPTGWTFFVVGALVAAAYNLFACDWIAEKVA
jgi:FtsH-binding integral membrane protein